MHGKLTDGAHFLIKNVISASSSRGTNVEPTYVIEIAWLQIVLHDISIIIMCQII